MCSYVKSDLTETIRPLGASPTERINDSHHLPLKLATSCTLAILLTHFLILISRHSAQGQRPGFTVGAYLADFAVYGRCAGARPENLPQNFGLGTFTPVSFKG